MGLFSAIVKTVVNTVLLPVAVVKDIVTLGGLSTGKNQTYTEEQIEKLKEESED